jgi:hypothetical protein
LWGSQTPLLVAETVSTDWAETSAAAEKKKRRVDFILVVGFGGVMKTSFESEELVQVNTSNARNLTKEPHVYTPS